MLSDNTRWVASVELTGVVGEIEVAVHRLSEREVVFNPSTRRLASTGQSRDGALGSLDALVCLDPFWSERRACIDSACAFLADNEGFAAFRVTTPC